jgi:signal transduction histidine kinase
MDAGIRSIRRVTDDLRPTLLDDLGLLPALRSLAT